jgi:HPt (histidine-containing phosphotransfer) domain-containing protein
MNDYLSKPVRPETLYAKLVRWLHRTTTTAETPAAEPTTEEPKSVLDMQTLKTLASLSVAGSADVLKRVIEVYLDFYPRYFAAIQRHREAGHWAELRREAHSLKAASGGIGLQKVAFICQMIEASAVQESAELAHLIERLETELETGVKAVKSVAAGAQPWTDPTPSLP